MKASLIRHVKGVDELGNIFKVKMWKIAERMADKPYGYKYSLVYIVNGERVIGYDNAAAIALYRKRDYAAAGIPQPPSVIGDEATRRGVLWTSLGLVPVTLAPVALGLLGGIYLAVAIGMNVWFVAMLEK